MPFGSKRFPCYRQLRERNRHDRACPDITMIRLPAVRGTLETIAGCVENRLLEPGIGVTPRDCRDRYLTIEENGQMPLDNMRGVIAPLLTPFNDDGSVAMDLYVAHANNLFDQGCVALAPFGTTGEALSVGIDERIAAMQSLVDAGVNPSRMIPGTGLSNIADTARLSGACLELGCAAVMTLPPFYYKAVSDDGLYAYFARLVKALGPGARIFLYHIPPVAVVGISTELAARLHADYPRQIVGIKDSSGDWNNTRTLLGLKNLIVYPGSELPLVDALELGAPGCITATANVNAANIAQVVDLYDRGDVAGARALHEKVKATRLLIQEYSPIPAQKRLLAINTGDRRWANVRPPLMPMSEARGQELAARSAQGVVDCRVSRGTSQPKRT